MTFLVEISIFTKKLQLNNWIKGNDKLWIGLSDKIQEGTFIWESGRQLSAEIAAHWFPGEPNGGVNEDCAVVHKARTIIDIPCSKKYAFVCQKFEGESHSKICSDVKNTESFHETSNQHP